MDGRYLSTKGHRGIGLSSITLLCDRLDGNATFGEEDGQFVSRVSLSLS